MTQLTRSFLTSIGSKRLFACDYICKEIRLNYALYHTFNKLTETQSKDFKCNGVIKRNSAIYSSIKFAYLNFTLALRNIYENGFGYIPLVGSVEYKVKGYYWYKSFEEVNVEEFFTLFGMPDTYYSRYKIIELHVWMLLFVLSQGTRKEKIIRYSLINAMWEDHENRAKMVQEINKNYKKNMKDLNAKFKVALLLYDLGYLQNDSSLANAIWCNFFSKESVDPRYLEALVSFIRHQIHHLDNLNFHELEKLEEKKGVWLSVKPHVNKVLKKV